MKMDKEMEAIHYVLTIYSSGEPHVLATTRQNYETHKDSQLFLPMASWSNKKLIVAKDSNCYENHAKPILTAYERNKNRGIQIER